MQELSYTSLSEEPGVYEFLGDNGEVLYVGKAKNLKRRVSSYFQRSDDLGEKTKILVSQTKKIKTTVVTSELESLLLEVNLIKKYNPKYNSRLTDGKTYLRVKITIRDEIPKILLARNEEDRKSVFFGPFPSSQDVKIVLKLIRRIFPYQSVANHPKRYCLYYHLGLCPCPPMFTTENEVAEYRKNIRRIVKFFDGKTKDVIKDLEEERDKESELENYENALQIQSKIDAIKEVTSKASNPFEYEINPNLKTDIRSIETKDLELVLRTNGINVQKLRRIECYDISNITGKHAVGSMVVFVNGEKDGSSYRRFKIKRPPKVIPNDFAMMREVISRRLNHKDWGIPDLIIVDGGKGQVSSANKALFENNANIPLIGIAKREELLISSDFKIIRLSSKSPALNLVKRIRDEAHRFAISYHKKLRSKRLFA